MISQLRCISTQIIRHHVKRLRSFNRANIHTTTIYNRSSIGNVNMERIIAVGQMCATNNKLTNRQYVQRIVESAAQQNACVSSHRISWLKKKITNTHRIIFAMWFQFVFLPECCDYVGSSRDETIALAEPLDGETVTFYRELAKKHNIWMSLGGIHEATYNEV